MRNDKPNAEHLQELTKLNDISVYITKPADYPHQPSKLLLLLTGGTGMQSVNNQLQADKFAGEGFLVVMPDQFGGDTAPGSTITSAQPEENPGILEQVKLGVASVSHTHGEKGGLNKVARVLNHFETTLTHFVPAITIADPFPFMFR